LAFDIVWVALRLTATMVGVIGSSFV
jgi:hypothetical protein